MARARCSVFPKVESYMINVFIFIPPSYALHERSSEFSPQDVDTPSCLFVSQPYPIMECNTWKARGHHERVLQAHICVTLSQGEVRTSPLHGCYSALACLSRCISFLDRITMAIRISKPPSACTGVMVSPSTRAASATATIGSKVESVEAVVGPMRLR